MALTDKLTAIGNAIRTQSGKTDKFSLDQMVTEVGELHPLNFKVVGGTSTPASPKGNTIWVNTSAAITGYYFGATQPSSPINGVVWICVGSSSTAPFNALKKEYLMVYPIFAKQYVNNAWVSKTAKSYQGGKWVEWIRYLLNITPTVEWKARAWRYSNVSYEAGAPAVEQTSSGVKITVSGNKTGAYEVAEDVDLTDIKTITATIQAVHSGSSAYFAVGKRSNAYTNQSTAQTTVAAGDRTIDVSSLTGLYDIYFYFTTNASFTASKVRLD